MDDTRPLIEKIPLIRDGMQFDMNGYSIEQFDFPVNLMIAIPFDKRLRGGRIYWNC